MFNGRTKHQSRENRRIVRALLMEEWDPIGVRGIPEASDEYDSYADRAYVMLMSDRASLADIEAYLVEMASEHMGLRRTPDILKRSRSVAERLLELRPQLLGG